RSHDQPEMIEWAPAAPLVFGSTLCFATRDQAVRTMKSKVFDARRKIDVVAVGLPFHRKSQDIHIESLHDIQIADFQREMTEAGVGGSVHVIYNKQLTIC